MKRFFPLFLLFMIALALPSTSTATLVSGSVVVVDDTPTHWLGYIDWTEPILLGSVTLDAGPNWTVGVVEVPVIAPRITAQHLVEPHAPPTPAGLFLFASFGLLPPGSSAQMRTTTTIHADDPGHVDVMKTWLVSESATTSRVWIELEHGDAVPEPATMGLVGVAGILLVVGRFNRK